MPMMTYAKDDCIDGSQRRRMLGADGGAIQIRLGLSAQLMVQPPHQLQQQQQQQQTNRDDAPAGACSHGASQPRATHHNAASSLHQAWCYTHDHRPVCGGLRSAASEENLRRSGSPSQAAVLQPSAPGQDTLQRPHGTQAPTSANIPPAPDLVSGDNVEDVHRPPPFNPGAAAGAHLYPSLLAGQPQVSEVHAMVDNSKQSTDKSYDAICSQNQTDVYRCDEAITREAEAMAPPSYDEIYRDQHRMTLAQSATGDYQQRDCGDGSLIEHAIVSELPCVMEFGRYSSVRTQPGGFSRPTRISVRTDTQPQREDAAIIVVDPSNCSVQVFTTGGECLSMLSVPNVTGACFFTVARTARAHPLLALAVGSAVAMYTLDGRLIKQIPLSGRSHDDSLVTVTSYGRSGFVAVRAHSLSVCRGGVTSPAIVRTVPGRYRVGRGPVQATMTPFVNILDVAVSARSQQLVVLDAACPHSLSPHRTAVYIMTEDGGVVQTVRPARDPRCGELSDAFGVAVDQGDRVLVSDAGRVLLFATDGRYLSALVAGESAGGQGDATDQLPRGNDSGIKARGLAVTSSATQQQLLFVVFSGQNLALVKAFQL